MFEEEIKAGKSFEEATKIFSLPASSRFLLIPEFNDALVKGGRLAPAAAAIAKLLKNSSYYLLNRRWKIRKIRYWF